MNVKKITLYCLSVWLVLSSIPLDARDSDEHEYDLGMGRQWTLEDLQGLVVQATDKQLVFKASELNTVAGRKGMEIEFSNNFRIKGPDQLFELFEIVLKKSGFVTKEILGGKVLIEKQDPKIKYMPHPYVDIDENDISKLNRKHSGLVTTVKEIKNTAPNDVVAALKQLLDSRIESVVDLRGTNTLIITAFPENVVRFHKIIKIMDQKAAQAKVKAYPIKYAEAKEVASTIKSVLQQLSRSNSTRAQQASRTRVDPMVEADDRTQKVIVVGLDNHFVTAEEVIKELDVPIDVRQGQIRIFEIRNRKAEDLVTTIENVYKKKKEVVDEANDSQNTPNNNVARPTRPAPGSNNNQSGADAIRPDAIPQLAFDRDTNTIIAISSSLAAYDELENIIKQLDVRQPQVFIEVAIIEVGEESERQLGFELLNLANATPGSVRGFGVTSFGNSTIDTDNPTGGRVPLNDGSSLQSGLVAGIFKGASERIPVLLRTIQNNSDSLLMDVPSILVTNNQEEAKFTSKQDVPTSRTNTTDTSTTSSFDYREAITELTIKNLLITKDVVLTKDKKPIKDANGNELARLLVQMEIVQESERFTTGTTDPSAPPAKAARKTETKVNIEDGTTVVIGGVSSYRDQNAVDSVPYVVDAIKSIPVIGSHVLGPFIDIFFERSITSHSRSTMYMFVTPHIIYNPKDLDKLNQRLMKEENLTELRKKWGLVGEKEKEEQDQEDEDKEARRKLEVVKFEKHLESSQKRHNAEWMAEAQLIRRQGENQGMSEEDVDAWVSKTYTAREHMFYLLNYIERYKIDRGEYPNDEDGLEALTKKSEEETEEPMMELIAKDPWKNEYGYRITNGRPSVFCLGGDGKLGGTAQNQDLYMEFEEIGEDD